MEFTSVGFIRYRGTEKRIAGEGFASRRREIIFHNTVTISHSRTDQTGSAAAGIAVSL